MADADHPRPSGPSLVTAFLTGAFGTFTIIVIFGDALARAVL